MNDVRMEMGEMEMNENNNGKEIAMEMNKIIAKIVEEHFEMDEMEMNENEMIMGIGGQRFKITTTTHKNNGEPLEMDDGEMEESEELTASELAGQIAEDLWMEMDEPEIEGLPGAKGKGRDGMVVRTETIEYHIVIEKI